MPPVIDYRSPQAPAARPKPSVEQSLELENLLITLFVLALFGAPIVLCLFASYAMRNCPALSLSKDSDDRDAFTQSHLSRITPCLATTPPPP